MAIRNIRQEGDPILRMKSRPVVDFDERLSTLIDDMIETLHKVDGVGLAAVQVGVLKRLFVVDVDENEGARELINPEFVKKDGEQRDREGCLSLPGYCGVTVRPAYIEIKAQDRHGEWHTYSGTELAARCYCHEYDHLDGILYKDRLADGEELFEIEDD